MVDEEEEEEEGVGVEVVTRVSTTLVVQLATS